MFFQKDIVIFVPPDYGISNVIELIFAAECSSTLVLRGEKTWLFYLPSTSRIPVS